VFKIKANGCSLGLQLVVRQIVNIKDIDLSPMTGSKVNIATESILTVHYNGKYAQFNVNADIIIFFRSGRYVKALTIHGNEYIIPQTISELEEKYKEADFCRINRSVLINCNTVRGYTTGEKRDSFLILLKPPYATIASKCKEANFNITKEYISVFRDRFQKM